MQNPDSPRPPITATTVATASVHYGRLLQKPICGLWKFIAILPGTSSNARPLTKSHGYIQLIFH